MVGTAKSYTLQGERAAQRNFIQIDDIGNHGPAGLLEYLDALEEALGRKAERN
jgi:hypothetical protein